MTPLILKRAPIGDNQDDYDVLEDGEVVGRIFTVPTAPPGRSWMWASGHSADSVRRAAHGYEATREAATAASMRSIRAVRRFMSIPVPRSVWPIASHSVSDLVHAGFELI